MKTTCMGLALLAGTALLQATLAGAQPKDWNWQADFALLNAQTNAIKALSKRIDELESRVQQW